MLSHKTKQICMVGHSLLDIAFLIYVTVVYRQNDNLNSQNKGAKLWIKTEIVTMLL